MDEGWRQSDTPRFAALVLALAGVLIASACASPDGPVPLAIQGHAPGPCLLVGAVTGTLVADPTWGIAFRMRDVLVGVKWPDGYSARRENGMILLLDGFGNVVAHEGDVVSMGNPVINGVVTPCVPVEVVPGPV